LELPRGARFHDAIASQWAAGYATGGFLRRRVCFAPIFDRNVGAGTTWLDLGCGAGVLTRDLLDRGTEVIAIDASPAMLREARSLVCGTERVSWLTCDVQSVTGVRDGSVDGVLCSSVVEYVEHPEAVLSEAARLLRPGGKLIVSVPPAASAVRAVQKLIRRLTLWAGHDPFPYLSVSRFELASADVRQWLEAAGFQLDRITGFDPILPATLNRLLQPALLILEAHKSV
jgi:ubiquinone/menaquinone biosynthesis C-methylase UbiE